jgi:cysteine desulfurase
MSRPADDPRRIYLDHAATTPVREEAREAMRPFLEERFGNPSSLHAEGRLAREALEAARESIRAACRAAAFDLLFTSGGTEADGAAVAGAVLAAREAPARAVRRPHVVTTAVEHAAVLNSLQLAEALGAETTVVGVDREGRVDPAAVADAMRPETVLVSVMAANNESGAVQPIEEAGRIARRRGALFHADAVQALGKLPLELDDLPADLVTVSAHKVGGPKGIGALLVRRGTRFEPLLRGGSQELGLRAGTENVACAAGFARAAALAVEERGPLMDRLGRLRDAIRSGIAARLPGAVVNTPARGALPTVLNVSFPWIEGESLVKLLDILGVAASTGSACNVGARKPSHVLRAMGRNDAEVRGSVRFSLGRSNTEADLDPILERLERAVRRLEDIAPARAGSGAPEPRG